MIKEKRAGEITTHETRREAHETVNKNIRYEQILNVLENNNRPMTAKEIANELYIKGLAYTNDRNITSPRITELLYLGKVDVVGRTKCEYSGKSVSCFVIRN